MFPVLSLELNLSRGIQDIQAYRANLGIQAHQEIQDILEPRVNPVTLVDPETRDTPGGLENLGILELPVNPVILVDLVILATQGLLATPAILEDRETLVTPELPVNQVTLEDREIRVTPEPPENQVTPADREILGIPEHLAILVTRVHQDGRVTRATPAHLVILDGRDGRDGRDGLVAPVILERQVILGIRERRAILATLA